MKIKKNDNVIVLSGKDKGKTGKVESVFVKQNKVLVSGVNVVKKHQKPTKSGGKGQILDKAMPIHISNVALVSSGKSTRVGFEIKGDKKIRISKKTGKEI